MHSLREMLHSLRAAPGFALALLITLAAAAFNGLAVFQPALIGGVIDMSDMHFVGAQHRTHDLAFGFLFLPGVVGIFAQFRRPSKNVAGQLMAVIPSAALLPTLVLTVVLTNNTTVLQPPWVTVMTSALIATTLHPGGRDLFRSFSDGRTSWVMLALSSSRRCRSWYTRPPTSGCRGPSPMTMPAWGTTVSWSPSASPSSGQACWRACGPMAGD